MIKGIDPEGIPRYEVPEQVYTETDEPETGACWNCCHMVEVTIDGKTYPLCARSRDIDGDGDVIVAIRSDSAMRDCTGWEVC